VRSVADPKPVLAVDIGGTKMLAALVAPGGQLTSRERQPTLAGEGPESVIERLFAVIEHLLDSENQSLSRLHGISLAVAGAIDVRRGLVTSSPHLPGWHDVPLRDMAGQKYGVDVVLLNDASAAALGEHRFGAGRRVKNLVLLTIGTGIGGGIIIDGQLYQGVSGIAGEVGHMTIATDGVRCPCGNIGCLETVVSGPALEDRARQRISAGERSVLSGMVDRIADIGTEDINAAARGGDTLALAIIAEAAECLGVGLVNLANAFDPEMIIIAGGLVGLGDLLLEPARKLVRQRAFTPAAQTVRIVPAALGDEAGVCGAAAYAWEQAR
jgi:glucokinase